MKVLPPSLWVTYQASNVQKLSSLLPSNLELASTRTLKSESREYVGLYFNIYRVKAALGMSGWRAEVNAFARDRESSTPHLVVLDCYTDCRTWDPLDGIQGANSRFSSSPNSLKLRSDDGRFFFSFASPSDPLPAETAKEERARRASLQEVDRDFVIRANRAVYFKNWTQPFPLDFDEGTVGKPVRLFDECTINTNIWEEYRSGPPISVFYHPHPMVFKVNAIEAFGRLF